MSTVRELGDESGFERDSERLPTPSTGRCDATVVHIPAVIHHNPHPVTVETSGVLLIVPALGFTCTHYLSDGANWEHIWSVVLRDASVRSRIPAPMLR